MNLFGLGLQGPPPSKGAKLAPSSAKKRKREVEGKEGEMEEVEVGDLNMVDVDNLELCVFIHKCFKSK